MNKKPVHYLQTDKRWKNAPYRVPGERATIGGSGCGPTSAAMAIETLTGKTYTPVDACAWSVQHGYKALRAGTYQSYFTPQFAAFGIDCTPINGLNHAKAKTLVNNGYYLIALMGKGLWTSGGHYILVWDWDDKVRINDSASTKDARLNGDPERFKKEVRKYWAIDARKYNKEDDEMLSYEQFKEYMGQYLKEIGSLPIPGWAKSTGEWEKAEQMGIIADQSRPQGLATRVEVAAMITRGITTVGNDKADAKNSASNAVK